MRERLQIVFFKNFFIQFVFTQEPIWLLIHITLENSQESTRKCVILVDALLGDLFYNFIEGLHNSCHRIWQQFSRNPDQVFPLLVFSCSLLLQKKQFHVIFIPGVVQFLEFIIFPSLFATHLNEDSNRRQCRIPVVLENRRSSRGGRGGCALPAPSPQIRPCAVMKREFQKHEIITLSCA